MSSKHIQNRGGKGKRQRRNKPMNNKPEKRGIVEFKTSKKQRAMNNVRTQHVTGIPDNDNKELKNK